MMGNHFLLALGFTIHIRFQVNSLDLLSYVTFDNIFFCRFESSSHAISMSAYLREQRRELYSKSGELQGEQGEGGSWMKGQRVQQGTAGAVWIGWWWRGGPEVIRLKSRLAMYRSPVRAASFVQRLCATHTVLDWDRHAREHLFLSPLLSLFKMTLQFQSVVLDSCVSLLVFLFPFFLQAIPVRHTLWNDWEGAQGVKKREVKDS